MSFDLYPPLNDSNYLFLLKAINESCVLEKKTDFEKIDAILRWISSNSDHDILTPNGQRISRATFFCDICQYCNIEANTFCDFGDELNIVQIDGYWYELEINWSQYNPDNKEKYHYEFCKIGRYIYRDPLNYFLLDEIKKLKAGTSVTLALSIRNAGFTKENGYSIDDLITMFMDDEIF